MAKLNEPGYRVHMVCNKWGVIKYFIYTAPYHLPVKFTLEQWAVFDLNTTRKRWPDKENQEDEFPFCFKNGRPVWHLTSIEEND